MSVLGDRRLGENFLGEPGLRRDLLLLRFRDPRPPGAVLFLKTAAAVAAQADLRRHKLFHIADHSLPLESVMTLKKFTVILSPTIFTVILSPKGVPRGTIPASSHNYRKAGSKDLKTDSSSLRSSLP